MPSSTYASESMDSTGKNANASGVYFDSNGNAKVQSSFRTPSIDPVGAMAQFNKELQDKSKYPSFKLDKGFITLLGTDGNVISFTSIGKNYLDKAEEIPITVFLKARDPDGNQYFRKVPTDWSYKNEYENRLSMYDASQSIASQLSDWFDKALDAKTVAERHLAEDQKNADTLASEDVQRVSDLLGVSKEDAVAYLAAGHTVKEAADKVASWNLASPSQRKFMMAQDALKLNENSNKGEEFKAGTVTNAEKNVAKPVDDMFKGIRNPYSERQATKAYIALVRESEFSDGLSNKKLARMTGKSSSVLLKLDQFFMQSVSEVDSEKYQIVETFNKPKIYFFDRRARVYQYSFVVENTGGSTRSADDKGNPWRDIFKNAYDQYLRGTKSVENRVKAVIHYDEVTRIGYVLSCSMSMDSQNENMASVQLAMFVEDEQQRNIQPSVNTFFEKDIVKPAEANAAKAKKTITWIKCDYNGTNESLTNLSVTDKILNASGKPGRESFYPLGRSINIALRELPAEGKADILTSTPSNGDIRLVSAKYSTAYGEEEFEDAEITDGIFLTTVSPESSGIKVGSTFSVPTNGIKAYVVIDTTSKFVQNINSKQGKDDVFIQYTFELKSEDEKPFFVSGYIKLASKVLDIKVSSPGNSGAKEYAESKTTIVKFNNSKYTSTNNVTGTITSKIYKGNFEIQLIDKVSGTVVTLPDGLKYDKYTMKMESIKGSISKDDSKNLSGILKLSNKDDKTITCDVSIEGPTESESLMFTADSCIFTCSIPIGSTEFNAQLTFTREKDVKSYSLLGVFAEASEAAPIQVSMKESPIGLVSRVVLVFDKDPGASIFSEIQFESNGSIATAIGKGKAKISGNLVAYSSYYLQGVYSKESEVALNYDVETFFLQASRGPMEKADAAKYGITTDTPYSVVITMGMTSAKTFDDFARTNTFHSQSTKLNGEKIPDHMYGVFTNISSSGILRIAKTKMNASVSFKWINSNTDKIYLF